MDDIEGRKIQARILLGAGEYRGARDALLRILEQDPEDAVSLFLLAESYFFLADYQQAERTALDALALDAALEDAHVLLGHIHVEQEFYKSAYHHVGKALSLNPSHTGALCLKARLFSLDRDKEQALEVIAQALRLAPGDADVLADAALVFLQIGQGREAGKLADRALEMAPDNARIAGVKSIVDAWTGKASSSRHALSWALRLAPDDHAVHGMGRMARFASAPLWLPYILYYRLVSQLPFLARKALQFLLFQLPMVIVFLTLVDPNRSWTSPLAIVSLILVGSYLYLMLGRLFLHRSNRAPDKEEVRVRRDY